VEGKGVVPALSRARAWSGLDVLCSAWHGGGNFAEHRFEGIARECGRRKPAPLVAKIPFLTLGCGPCFGGGLARRRRRRARSRDFKEERAGEELPQADVQPAQIFEEGNQFRKCSSGSRSSRAFSEDTCKSSRSASLSSLEAFSVQDGFRNSRFLKVPLRHSSAPAQETTRLLSYSEKRRSDVVSSPLSAASASAATPKLSLDTVTFGNPALEVPLIPLDIESLSVDDDNMGCWMSCEEPELDEDVTFLLQMYQQSATRFRSMGKYPDDLDRVVHDAVIMASRMSRRGISQGIDLCLNDAHLGEQGSCAIAELVSLGCNVRSLSVAGTRWSPAASEELGRGLRLNKALVALNLSDNPLTEGGLRELLRFLCSNETLLDLRLSNVDMNFDGACVVANAIFLNNNNLQTLDISNNGLETFGVEALARTIPCHFKITTFIISGNGGNSSNKDEPLNRRKRRLSDSSVKHGSSSGNMIFREEETGELGLLSFEECQRLIESVLVRNRLGEFPVIEKQIIGYSDGDKTDGMNHDRNAEIALPLSFGHAEMQGHRSSMQDVVVIQSGFRENDAEHLFGVFDGHGGVECAKFASMSFPRILEEELNAFRVEPGSADSAISLCLQRAFKSLQQRCRSFQIQNGTCALVSYVNKKTLYVATVGDSKALLVQPSTKMCRWMSNVVFPDDEQEKQRVEAAGGFVNAKGRVCGLLAVSRAIGDVMYGDIISEEPFIEVQGFLHDAKGKSSINPQMEKNESLDPAFGPQHSSWLIMGCDGVWDVLNETNALAIIEEGGTDLSPEVAADKVRQAAFTKGSTDNISVICIKFGTSAPLPTSPMSLAPPHSAGVLSVKRSSIATPRGQRNFFAFFSGAPVRHLSMGTQTPRTPKFGPSMSRSSSSQDLDNDEDDEMMQL